LFLQAAWRAIEDAGYRPSSLAGSATGLFAGVSSSDYDDLLTERGVPVEAHRATGIAHAVLANRVSHLLDLRGPSEAIDTACSSALVAVNHGGRSASLTAPHPAAQAAVVVAAHRDAGVDPATVTYVEAHGTGTPLGDPVEIEGLKRAFATLLEESGRPRPERPHIAVGS